MILENRDPNGVIKDHLVSMVKRRIRSIYFTPDTQHTPLNSTCTFLQLKFSDVPIFILKLMSYEDFIYKHVQTHDSLEVPILEKKET